MSKNKQLFINLITTLFVLLINIFINFGLSKYIVETIGKEAYGFISLANNFVSYATIFTTALNSMGSRFITLDIHNKRYKSANAFFSSLLIANIIIVLLLIVPSVFLIIYLEYLIKIPSDIILDVKLLFSFIFLNFAVSLINGVFTVATYCTNKVYLSSIKNMESNILKAMAIGVLFILFKPAVFYVGIATLLATIFVFMFNIKFTHDLLPDVKIDKKYFSFRKIKILLVSGLWNSITNLGNILADGLDLVISNLAIDSATMGVVAISKVPSNVLNTVISGISNVFQPQIISFYSSNKIDEVVSETKKGMKISGLFGNISFCFILVFGAYFCKIWMPNIDSILYYICIITFINVYCGGLISPLYNIFTITNHVKYNALLNVFSGIISTIIVLLLLKFTKLGVYAIVGVSAIVGLLKGFIIVPIYCAKSLDLKYSTFFSTIFKYIYTSILLSAVYFLIRFVFIPSNWLTLIILVGLCGIVGLFINYYVFLDKYDRESLVEIFLSKINKRSETNG